MDELELELKHLIVDVLCLKDVTPLTSTSGHRFSSRAWGLIRLTRSSSRWRSASGTR